MDDVERGSLMIALRGAMTLALVVLSMFATIALAASPAGAGATAPASSGAGWSVGTKLVVWTYGSNRCVNAAPGAVARLDYCSGSGSEAWRVRAIHTVQFADSFTGYQLVNSAGACLVPAGSSNASGTIIHGVKCDNSATDHRQLWCVLPGNTDAPKHAWIFFNGKSGLFLESHDNDHINAPLYEYNRNHAPANAGQIFGDRNN